MISTQALFGKNNSLRVNLIEIASCETAHFQDLLLLEPILLNFIATADRSTCDEKLFGI